MRLSALELFGLSWDWASSASLTGGRGEIVGAEMGLMDRSTLFSHALSSSSFACFDICPQSSMRHPGREGYDRWQVVSAGQKPLEDFPPGRSASRGPPGKRDAGLLSRLR